MAQALGEGRRPQAAGRRPTIFMWQSSGFELVTGSELPEWERRIREHVGVPASDLLQDADGSACVTPTLPKECMDDCDYLPE